MNNNNLKKDEYTAGDFIEFEHDNYRKRGIIVIKERKDQVEREMYWFKNEWNYLVSLKEFKGDYKHIDGADILWEKIYKPDELLSYLGNFGDWWFIQHKDVYQEILIKVIKNIPKKKNVDNTKNDESIVSAAKKLGYIEQKVEKKEKDKEEKEKEEGERKKKDNDIEVAGVNTLLLFIGFSFFFTLNLILIFYQQPNAFTVLTG